jgi:hypothetical protein
MAVAYTEAELVRAAEIEAREERIQKMMEDMVDRLQELVRRRRAVLGEHVAENRAHMADVKYDRGPNAGFSRHDFAGAIEASAKTLSMLSRLDRTRVKFGGT